MLRIPYNTSLYIYLNIVEAVKAMGYGVIPNHNEPLLPCVCGSKRRHNIASFNYVTGEETFALECMKCGRRAEGKSRKQVKHNWNRMIEETGKAE